MMSAMLFLAAAALAEVEPPLVGQPREFSGAVGPLFRVEMRVQPADAVVEEPVTLTVRVLSPRPAQRPPRRLDLDLLSGGKFSERFLIAASRSDQPDRTLSDGQGWEFDYELRPRRVGPTQIPGLRFVFYRPGVGDFPAILAGAVPLTVGPRPRIVRPVQADERLFALAEGSAVQRPGPAGLPTLPWLVILVLAPPLVCVLGYALWARLNPNPVRQARHRRSRAGRHALQTLRQGEPATAVADYLRQRFDLPPAEPTPVEVENHLRGIGMSAALADQAREFFRACDAARYAPAPPGDDLRLAARELVDALEATAACDRVAHPQRALRQTAR